MHFAATAKTDASDVITELHARGVAADAKGKGVWVASVDCGDGYTPLHLCEHAGSARTLMSLGADPDAFGVLDHSNMGTATFMAAANGRASVLKALFDAGALPSPSYAWWAAKMGKAEVVKMMIDRGNLDLGYKRDGKTFIQAAIAAGRSNKNLAKKAEAIVGMLRGAGALEA